MDGNDKSEHEPYKEEQALWDAYRGIRQARGINIGQVFAEWAAKQAQELPSPGARQDFDELCKHGCNPQVLAAIVGGLRNSPRLEAIWTIMVGPIESRQKTIQALEKAAATLEEIFGTFIAVEDEKDREEFAKIGRIPPSRMVSELQLYGRLINMAKSLGVDTESRSLGEVSKFILSHYVERTTGRPHDRCVSGLIATAVNSPDYTEVAYRMWRNRHYDRLERHFSWITDFLVAMSVVMARRA
jgi:hypothetical protein